MSSRSTAETSTGLGGYLGESIGSLTTDAGVGELMTWVADTPTLHMTMT